MRVDLTDLRVFLHTLEAGSMTAAANRAHLTLAAVSARVRALESSLGLALLERHARGVAPSPAGHLLAGHARFVFRQLDALQEELSSLAPARERIVLLANSSALARPLGGFLVAALRDHPHLHIDVRESSSDVTVHALRAGAADLGLVSDAADTAGLDAVTLGKDPLAAVLPAGHPLAGRASLQLRDLLGEALVIWRSGSALHTHLAMHALRAGAALKERVAVHSAGDAVVLAAAGVGPCVLPKWLANGVAPGRDVVVRPLADAWSDRHLLLCQRPRPGVHAQIGHALREAWEG